MDKISMSESLRNNEVFSVKKLSNPKIFTTKNGKLEEIDKVTEGDVRVLEEAGILRKAQRPFSINFDLDSDYFPPAFVKGMIEAVREKYSDLVAELPISFVELNSPFSNIPMEHGAGLDVIYGPHHTMLTALRPVANGKTEVYVLDAYSGSANFHIGRVSYDDTKKPVIKYPTTDVSEDAREKMKAVLEKREILIKSYTEKKMYDEVLRLAMKPTEYDKDKLMIQTDRTHCISYAIHFAEKIYKAMRGERARSNCTVLGSFYKVMDKFEILQDKDVGPPYEMQDKFRMPCFLTKHSGSEDALEIIAAATAKRGKGDEAAAIEKSKDKLKLYKNIRKEKCEEQTENLRGELESTELELEKAKRAFTEGNVAEVGGEDRKILRQIVEELGEKSKTIDKKIQIIETRMREIYSPAANWRNKDIKRMAGRLRIIKEKEKEKDRDRGREGRGPANFPVVLLGLQGFLLKIWRITVVVLLRIQTVLLATLRLERARGVDRNRRIVGATEEFDLSLGKNSAKSHHE
jgi:hypothetical protein